jgi:hypothetical protein
MTVDKVYDVSKVVYKIAVGEAAAELVSLDVLGCKADIAALVDREVGLRSSVADVRGKEGVPAEFIGGEAELVDVEAELVDVKAELVGVEVGSHDCEADVRGKEDVPAEFVDVNT